MKTLTNRKYMLTSAEYNIILQNKVKSGMTYEEAKRALAIELNIADKTMKEYKNKEIEQANEEEAKLNASEDSGLNRVFKDKFKELKYGRKE